MSRLTTVSVSLMLVVFQYTHITLSNYKATPIDLDTTINFIEIQAQ